MHYDLALRNNQNNHTHQELTLTLSLSSVGKTFHMSYSAKLPKSLFLYCKADPYHKCITGFNLMKWKNSCCTLQGAYECRMIEPNTVSNDSWIWV